MREHQIVITLKPEQLAEVQRLSKAAGAKSMGIFVRKALLASLGLEGASPQGASGSLSVSSEESMKIAEGLRRLQKELKILVADTLSQAESTVADQVVAVSSSLAELQAQTQVQASPRNSQAASVPTKPVEEELAPEEDLEEDLAEEPVDLIEDDDESGLVRDPLEDLLDRSLMERLKDYKDAVDRSKERTTKRASSSKEEPSESDEPELPDTELGIDELKKAGADDDDNSASSGADSDSSTQFDQKIPPFSGGPPPKRRP